MAPQKRSERTIRLIRPPAGDQVGILSICDRYKFSFYAFGEVPCEIGGRGFAVHRLGLGELYHVRIGAGNECSCECLGFLRHGRCKHVLAIMALAQHGLLKAANGE